MNGKNKTLKSIRCFMELTGIWMLAVIAVVGVSAVNIINAATGYSMELADGLWKISPIFVSMGLMISAVAIVTSYMMQYNLLSALPVSMETAPRQISLIIDVIMVSVIAVDAIALAIAGMPKAIFVKLAGNLFMYILVRLTMYVSARTTAKTYGTLGGVLAGILGAIAYGVGGGVGIFCNEYISEELHKFEEQYAGFIILDAVVLTAFVLTYILTQKGMKNCIRQTKKYKGAAKKKTAREEVYV